MYVVLGVGAIVTTSVLGDIAARHGVPVTGAPSGKMRCGRGRHRRRFRRGGGDGLRRRIGRGCGKVEAVAHTVHGMQVARRLRVLPQRVPQQGHQAVQHPPG